MSLLMWALSRLYVLYARWLEPTVEQIAAAHQYAKITRAIRRELVP
jgi:hypothetical protein